MRRNKSLLACLIIGSMIINTSCSFYAGELKEDNISEDSVLSDSDFLFEEYFEEFPEEDPDGYQEESFGEDFSMLDEFLIEDADEEAPDAFLPEETEQSLEASDAFLPGETDRRL